MNAEHHEQLDQRQNASSSEWAVMLAAPTLEFTPAPHGVPITGESLRQLSRPPTRRSAGRHTHDDGRNEDHDHEDEQTL